MSTINLLTSSPFKIATAQQFLQPYGYTVNSIPNTWPEIQADSSLDVARYGALLAAAELNQPILREDHSFHIHALKNFPGTAMAMVEKTLTATQLLNLMADESDRSAHFFLAMVFALPSGDFFEFEASLAFQIATELLGDEVDLRDIGINHEDQRNAGWSQILLHEGESRSIAEYSYHERLPLFTDNYRSLIELLSNRPDLLTTK